LDTLIDNLSEDNVITVIEKQFLSAEWVKVQNEFSSTMQIAAGYWKPEEKIFERDMYTQRYEELKNFLTVEHDENNKAAILSPSNMIKDSVINGDRYKSCLKNYFESRNKMNELILFRTKEIADTAQKNVDEVTNHIVYKVEIRSTNGTTFKNGQISTELEAHVYHGATDVTNTTEFMYKWTRKSADSLGDNTWNKAHENAGKKVTITNL
ncbi:hypothetical protein CN579_33245, partial [Bacillus toyonensis]